MTFATLVRSVLLSAVLVPAAVAAPAPRLQLQPVELVGYVGDALKVQVELPCGSELYGLVIVTPEPARQAAKKDLLKPAKGRLEIAAAVLQDAIVCTTLTMPKVVIADFIATRRFDVIAPLAVESLNPKITVARLSDLKVHAGRPGITPSEVEAIYQTKCGSPLGALVRPGRDGRLEVGIVERSARPGQYETCTPKTERRRLTALRIDRHEIAPLPEKPGSLSRAFVLRYATIKKGSLRRGPAQGVSLAYERGCNDAPVGIVMKDLAKKDGGKRLVELGVVVAHYYNFPCKNAHGKRAFDRIEDGDLRLGKQLTIKMKSAPKQAKAGEALVLKTPTALTMAGEGGLQVGYVRPCGQVDGAIYARDARGKLSVGVVVNSTGRCTRRGPSAAGASEVSLYQPFVAERVRTMGIAPLRLKGQPAH